VAENSAFDMPAAQEQRVFDEPGFLAKRNALDL
jgi:hypothetical protein